MIAFNAVPGTRDMDGIPMNTITVYIMDFLEIVLTCICVLFCFPGQKPFERSVTIIMSQEETNVMSTFCMKMLPTEVIGLSQKKKYLLNGPRSTQ